MSGVPGRVANVSDQRIRPITPADVPAVVEMVHSLADYEHAPEDCQLTTRQLHVALFDDAPALFGHVATDTSIDPSGAPLGAALWFLNFSTWRGVHGIYLEDLFVQPHARGKGLGRALLTNLAKVCVERGYGRLEWAVLDWNTPARDFYTSLGASGIDEWVLNRLDGAALRELAAD